MASPRGASAMSAASTASPGCARSAATSAAQTGDVKLTVTEADMSGKMVLEAEHISKSFGERVIVEDFSTRIIRGDRIGIVGANGAGKTTLLQAADRRARARHRQGPARLQSASSQRSTSAARSLDPTSTLKEALTGGGSDTLIINGQPKHVIGYMKDFLFRPEQARTAVEKLSGGERGRLALARALALPSNFLVLDEPTNDLDLETLDLLQEMLGDYPGTVIVVSHDRDFLDRVATSVIVAEGEGRWTEYAGGYSDMVAQRGYGVTKPRARARPPRRERAAASAAAARRRRRRKLSFKQKHALETLPKEIARLDAEIDRAQRPARRSEALRARSQGPSPTPPPSWPPPRPPRPRPRTTGWRWK